MNIVVKKYDDTMFSDLEAFAFQAVQDGMLNNSIDKMKLDKVHYWVGYYNNKIICVSGMEDRGDSWWLVRQATLHKYHGLLGYKKMFGAMSIAVKWVQPPSVKYCEEQNDNPIYTSVNIDNHAGPWMTRVNKHVNRFAKLGLFTYEGRQTINHVTQDVFRINNKGFWEYTNKLQEIDDDIKTIE